MAKDPETEPRRKRSAGTSIAVWILMGMLIVGLGGFGVSNFGGGVTSVGTVGDRKIDVNDYARALQQELDALAAQFGQRIPLQQAIAFGVDRQVLQSVVTRAALDNEASRIGLSVGDATIAAEITGLPAFQGTAGTFDRETYRFTLNNSDLTERDFEDSLREDVARSLLQGAVVGGFAAPAQLTETLYAWVAERRDYALLTLTEADLAAPLADPTDADLTAFHEANIDRFTRPEAKRITYAALLPDAIAADMAVDETALRALYDTRISEFVQPERRLVERLVFADDAAAATAMARIDAGEAFETIVAERGLSVDDIDLGDVSARDLGPAGEAVFALDGPGVVGPFDSALGPALFRMNAVLAAQETTFDAAREGLAAEAQADAARRAIADQVEGIDDLLAGGATLQELATETGMELGTIDYVPGSEGNVAIAAYAAFRDAADAVAIGDFAEAVMLVDGGVVALHLDEIVPPAPIPFDEARDAVVTAWRADTLARALSDRAVEIKAGIEAGATLESFGIVSVTANSARESFVEGAPAGLMTAVFDMDPGDLRVIEGPDFVAVLRLDTVTAAATEGDDATALREAIAVQAEQAIAQDAFTLFTNALSAEAGITLDQTAINAVHATFQ